MPALGLTWWAYLLYCLIAFGLIWYIRTLVLARIEAKKQLEEERIEKEKIEGINKLKLKFFTNISHDFRTPLTLIVAPLQSVIDAPENSPETKYQLGVIQRNTLTLLELINQLLNFRKIEEGEMKLNISENNMITFIENIKLSFEDLARRKNISFHFTHDVESIHVWFDVLEFKKVIINILSNAFKFTPIGGEIIINLEIPEHNKDSVQVSVRDSGIGIAKEKIKFIFDRYFQLGVTKGKRAGTGLGLSLSKDIIELHKGSIRVLSEEGEGVLFSINLPLGNKHLNIETDSAKDKELQSIDLGLNKDVVISEVIETEEEIEQTVTNNDLPTILLVEDNAELRKFIKSLFDKEFNVLEANNGAAGLDLAQNKSVDLIISDVMMPIMNGIDLCNNIKSNIKTSHIPVMLLTAKASIKAQKEGYSIGADVYIPKPFDAQMLKLQVTNLINLRKSARNKFKNDALLTPTELTNVSLDEEFLKKAFRIVEESMSDNRFNAQEFTEKMGVSRTLLFNKLKALTGQSLTEFIRSVKLKKAAQYLINSKMNVSEIAYDVGFNDLKYFRTNFKKMYNSSPSAYRKAHTKDPL
ncbi:DNA-binding response regulator [Algibacter lectus]|uniref:histidine kinase n=1 Tax=Algibacter lectus TaxID=221126 RepID=A0A090WYB5_9FLAO|nr:ATP-binding protein [Algibacter lectus]GAL82090.1 DNA-binding response regulator [Algibacter lectus]